MNRVVRGNICAPYSLHDMNVIEFEVKDSDIIMKTQSGIVRAVGQCEQVDGYVEFNDIDWDFCFVYLMDCTGNTGTFSGEKMMLADFLKRYESFGFSIIDEAYGYNQTKYWGYLTANRMTKEGIIEIYHLGDMVFVEA